MGEDKLLDEQTVKWMKEWEKNGKNRNESKIVIQLELVYLFVCSLVGLFGCHRTRAQHPRERYNN